MREMMPVAAAATRKAGSPRRASYPVTFTVLIGGCTLPSSLTQLSRAVLLLTYFPTAPSRDIMYLYHYAASDHAAQTRPPPRRHRREHESPLTRSHSRPPRKISFRRKHRREKKREEKRRLSARVGRRGRRQGAVEGGEEDGDGEKVERRGRALGTQRGCSIATPIVAFAWRCCGILGCSAFMFL